GPHRPLASRCRSARRGHARVAATYAAAMMPRHLVHTIWMRVLWLLMALALVGAEAAAAGSTDAAEPPRTLRVDLVHTGGRGTEVMSLDRVVLEPLPWPGNPAGDVGPENVGSY